MSKDIYHRARAYLNNTDRFDTYTDNGANLNTRLNGYLSDDFGYMKNGDLHQRIKRLQGNGANSNGGLDLSQRLNNYISDSDFYPSAENQNINLQQRLNNYLSGSPVENSSLTNGDISGRIKETKIPDYYKNLKIEKDVYMAKIDDMVKYLPMDDPNIQVIRKPSGLIRVKYTNTNGISLEFSKQSLKDIVNSIESKSIKNNVGDNTEAKVAKFIIQETNQKVIAFSSKVKNINSNQIAGDMDILTPDYIIEVKKASSSIDLKQIYKYTNSNHENYFSLGNKKIILYIDEPINISDSMIVNKIQKIKATKKVIIINSLEDLKGVLK